QEKTREDIHAVMRSIAEDDGITVRSLVSGRSVTGTAGVDVGGPSFRPVKQSNALLVVGRGINLYDAGEVWHLLDYRMDMPLTLRDRDRLADIDWSKYTHIIFPAGEYEEYEPSFADRLRLWVAEGGTLIGMRSAAPWVRATTLDWVDPESDEALEAVLEEETDEAPVERLPYASKRSKEADEVVGGAIFAADLDNTHPLGFGYDRRAVLLHKNVKEPMEPTDNPWGAVITYNEKPAYSGFVSEENEKALAGTAALIAERAGRGTVILFADNPNFRGYWYGTNKLFLNALFFSKAFDAPAEE
ncbi:MAG: peptidase, partial [Gammaproteobacteria bacterium]|nr:peptidase [Gammaproteobacteria bacterium]